MSYSARTNADNVFGSENITKWADLNGVAYPPHIESRVTWAIGQADARIDAVMRNTHYRVPVVDADGNTPSEIEHLSATLAGVLLHDARSMAEDDSMAPYRAEVERTFALITAGRLDINAVY